MCKKKNLDVIMLVLLYFALLLMVLMWLTNNNYLIKIADVNEKNVFQKMGFDILLLMPTVIMLICYKTIYKMNFKMLNINLNNWKFLICLVILLAIQVIIKRNEASLEYYRLFYYLLIIAVPEEVVSRGIMYNQLKEWNKEKAIIISGIVWGTMHSLLIWLQNGMGLFSLVSTVGLVISYVIINYFVIFLYDKVDNLLIIILLHAFLDAM